MQRCQRLQDLQLGPVPDQGPDPDLTPDLTPEAALVQDPENVAIGKSRDFILILTLNQLFIVTVLCAYSAGFDSWSLNCHKMYSRRQFCTVIIEQLQRVDGTPDPQRVTEIH